ncbi:MULTISPECIES: M20/M25/M40 family metallo-hydrolase [unclassified Fusibacter]|uniref:M20/M25/M40 family metallo-hydrolase n=1 Tax=unclassified Fusibacter TaxID=2624464 RepID=UPI001010A18B|nr:MULTISPECIES: M20/M25/M40 family metallo-hydrolase [unclassified Fusibacter]MCK8058172.1 M20/M25/M40 family metallo-hydrolase [Fusibacter sp. A2]NPE20755.1 M20/M25/M40 family metallo-hydrolase [Fusibacter sp. A1]RXV62962.1 M42 family peptidase [Fusibacter sp. A1]
MNKKFLETLIKCPSPSGDEVAIQKLWMNELKPYAHKMETDFSGNAIAILNPEAAFKVLLAGHCDEIAFMVQYIDDKGFVYVNRAGGINPKLALGSRVRIYGKEVVKGVVSVNAEHKGGEKGEIKVEDLTIDCGASSKDAIKELVSVGDYVIYDMDYDYLLNNTMSARALDNRSGAFIVGEVIKALSKEDLNVGVYGVSTVNEETTAGGAHFATAQIQPDMAIACDVTFATDGPGANLKKDGDVKLGGGPVISYGSQINFKINDMIKATAKKYEHKLQFELTPNRTGTDADRMRFTGKGVPVALISLPLRYMHSPSEVVSLDDIQEEINLLVNMIKDMTGKENLKPLE